MGVLGALRNKKGAFDDIVDLIIILIVLEFLCECVLGDKHSC
ncbi:MAG: hypothetical protein ACOYI2_11065 [Bacillota bacterium]|jgi:hypothetical protein